jgi:hypothetical protein
MIKPIDFYNAGVADAQKQVAPKYTNEKWYLRGYAEESWRIADSAKHQKVVV